MATDQELITRAEHDHVEGWNDANVARLDRALPPDLVERSPAQRKTATEAPIAAGTGSGLDEAAARELYARVHHPVASGAGRLDGGTVQAVLDAAGHRVRRRAGLPSGLTAREVEVLVRLSRGRSNSEIAAELYVSRKTVSSHLEHIYAKLGVKTRIEAALAAMRHGLIVVAGEPGT